MRQTLCVNRDMPLDTANLFVRIVAFFHGGIRVLHTLRINDQERGCFITSLLVALRNHLISLTLHSIFHCQILQQNSAIYPSRYSHK